METDNLLSSLKGKIMLYCKIEFVSQSGGHYMQKGILAKAEVKVEMSTYKRSLWRAVAPLCLCTSAAPQIN